MEIDRGLDNHQRPGAGISSDDGAYDLVRSIVRSSGFDWAFRPVKGLALERFIAWARLISVIVAPLAITFAIAYAYWARGHGWIGASIRALATVIAVLGVPAALLAAAFWWHERRDVPMDPRDLDPLHVAELAKQEDLQSQNHLASITIVKPGRFRQTMLRIVLWAANLLARTSTKGKLKGIPTIHFAHWSLLDGGTRLLFLSNYDGGWSSYLDDFVDLASHGLTAIWSNTVGFPRTRFLLFGGAQDREAFKAFARSQQTRTAVWYSAYPNLTVPQTDSNSAVRLGLVTRPRGDDLTAWLRRLGGGNAPHGAAPRLLNQLKMALAADRVTPVEALEFDDIQGLVLSSHSRLPCSSFILLRVTDAAPAREWLARHVDEVTTAAEVPDIDRALQMAFTHDGLEALGLPYESLTSFSSAFVAGMASERYARILGDREETAPAKWCWGGPNNPVHVLLLLYARNMDELRRNIASLTPRPGDGLAVVKELVAGREHDDNREHFGFVDGVGQPVIAGSGREQYQRTRTGHATEIPAGEILLGYENADNIRLRGPLLPPEFDGYEMLPALSPEISVSDRRDLGRNGTYLVFRQLEQDVPGFWRAVTFDAERLWPEDKQGPMRLAAKMVGRWPSGAPLVKYPDADPKGANKAGRPEKEAPENDFAFADEDPDGLRCPLGAHIRRANPRDSLAEDPEESRASVNRRRLMRRGRSYGRRIEDRLTPDNEKRGLFFICLNADLERQFVFVQQTWINNPGFSVLHGEMDPMIARHDAQSHVFTMPDEPMRQRVLDMRSFVTMRGGAFWFLPGLKALKVILRATNPR
jgi:Dyp-type peroxidase family